MQLVRNATPKEPQLSPSHYNRSDPGHFVLLKFNSTIFEQYAAEWTSGNKTELIPSFSRSDPLIYGIGWALKTELETDGLEGSLYVDSLTTTLVNHLLRHYSIQKQTVLPTSQELSKQQLKQVVEYIDHHLDQNLTLTVLAAIVRLLSELPLQSCNRENFAQRHEFVLISFNLALYNCGKQFVAQ